MWVKVNIKAVPNPKLAPEGEAGIIVERLSDSTYKVLRHDRKRKKKVTLNITQIKRRHSHHPEDLNKFFMTDTAALNLDCTRVGEFFACPRGNVARKSASATAFTDDPAACLLALFKANHRQANTVCAKHFVNQAQWFIKSLPGASSRTSRPQRHYIAEAPHT